MLFRVIIFLIGFSLALSGGVSTIAYLNLLTTGHGYYEYFTFIGKSMEVYIFLIGIMMIWLSIYDPFKKKT